MDTLWQPLALGNLRLENRFVRSATFEGLAGLDGQVTPALAALSADLARGGVGLIVTGNAFVRGDGRTRARQIGIHDPAMLPGLTCLVQAVHQAGGKIAVQISHAGRFAEPLDPDQPVVGIWGGQAGSARGVAPDCRELCPEEIAGLVHDFARAAALARRAGFDAVQLHAAHGYFLSQTLSPFFNRRQDEHGGSLENRARMLLQICRATRQAAGKDFPVLVKINSQDFLDPGLAVEESARVCAWLEAEGVCAVEISGGTMLSPLDLSPVRFGKCAHAGEQAWFAPACRRIKERLAIPVMLVGGIRDYAVAATLTQDGTCDGISLCRPLIREPGLIGRWREGDRRGALCLSDNFCYREVLEGRGLACVHESKRKRPVFA